MQGIIGKKVSHWLAPMEPGLRKQEFMTVFAQLKSQLHRTENSNKKKAMAFFFRNQIPLH